MKILIILLVISSAACFGQDENKYSIGADANYHHYFTSENIGDPSYGVNIFLSQNIARTKVSAGIGYSTYNAHWNPDIVDGFSDYLYKEEYKAQYLNIPILFYFNNRLDRKFNFSPYIGMIFNTAINYERIRYFTDKLPENISGIEAVRNTGLTLRIGTNVAKAINHNVVLSTAFFIDYKAQANNFMHDGKFEQPEGRLTLGLKIGMDYLL